MCGNSGTAVWPRRRLHLMSGPTRFTRSVSAPLVSACPHKMRSTRSQLLITLRQAVSILLSRTLKRALRLREPNLLPVSAIVVLKTVCAPIKSMTDNYTFTGGLKGNLGEFANAWDQLKTWEWDFGVRYNEDYRIERFGGIVNNNALRVALLDTDPTTAFDRVWQSHQHQIRSRPGFRDDQPHRLDLVAD